MFMHGGLLHLGGNMLFLWIFGNNVEDAMGPVKFVVFYLLGGRRGAARCRSSSTRTRRCPTLGASGAIAGVLGGYLLLFPKARVVTVIFIVFFFTMLELPALLVLGLWFLQQAVFAAMDIGGSGGGVAYFAHVGGFVFGLAAIRLFASRKRVDDAVGPGGLLRCAAFLVAARRCSSRSAAARTPTCAPTTRRAPRAADREGAARPAAGLGHGAAGGRRHGALAALGPAGPADRRIADQVQEAAALGAGLRPRHGPRALPARADARSCRSPR